MTPKIETISKVFSGLKADYQMAQPSRFRRARPGVNSTGKSGDHHYRSQSEFLRMIEYARSLDREDPIIGQGVGRLVSNVVREGMRLDPQTGDPAIDADLRSRWEHWAMDPEQCDAAGERDWRQLELAALRSTIVDGDIMFLPLRDGSLESVEAHRCLTPRSTKQNVVHGVKLNSLRKHMEYWFAPTDIDPYSGGGLKVADMRRVATRDETGLRQVFHVYLPKRISQTRGVTAFAPIADMAGMHDDLQFAALVQQQIVSCFAMIRQRAVDFDANPSGETVGAVDTHLRSDGTTQSLDAISPGMEVLGAAGETIQGFSPNVPSPQFQQHVMVVLTIIAVNLNLPVAVLLLDPSNTNFSGWRGAIDQARHTFREIQGHLLRRLHRPTYWWKLAQWLSEDPILARAAERDNVDIRHHRWQPPSWPYIEPLKDAQADAYRLRNALTSPRRLHSEGGRDWPEIVRETIEDNAMAITAAKTAAAQVNEQFPGDVPLHWRELISIPVGEGTSLSLPTATADPEPDTAPGGDADDDE